jgi:hypothetical protein
MRVSPTTLVSFCFIVVELARAENASPTNYFQAPSTRRMAERLEKIAQEVHPENSIFFCAERVAKYRPKIEALHDTPTLLRVLPSFGQDLLNAGQSQEAIQTFNRIEKIASDEAPGFWQARKLDIQSLKALAYLRLGEQENCLSNHTTDSCLFPIQGQGVHKFQRGSRAAIEILKQTLEEFPDDLKCRWLLNIAYMTVGEYPGSVPAPWLIPPSAFKDDYEMPRFPDVAPSAGANIFGLSGGSVMEDFDGDGLLDIMTTAIGLHDPMHFFHNNGDGTFTDRTREAGLTGEVGGLNLIQADYNNDGFMDVLVLRGAWFGTEGHYPKSLLRNNGNGTFTDVTEEARLLSLHPTQTAVWFDFNNDGLIDLFIGHESGRDDVNPCELYRNNGDGTFTECAAAAGVAFVGIIKGVASGDFNNDGRPDLYISRRGQPNILLRNDGPKNPSAGARSAWQFTDVGEAAGVTSQVASFPTWFFDYDNDGWPDIFVAGYYIKSVGDIAAEYLGLPNSGERARLYHNNRDGTFTDVSKEAHLDKILHGMGSNYGDLDNDGFLDFYIGTGDPDLATLIPNRMFRNAGGKFFQEVTSSGGFGHLQKGHGVSFGDIDNDGDQDVFEVMGGAYAGDTAYSVLYENPGNKNHWITLRLQGTRSNRAAIGARIKVEATGPSGTREIYRTVSSGGSFGGNPLRQEIGLGDATAIASIEVFWPVTGKTQVFTSPPLDRFYALREDSATLEELHLPKFQFSRQAPEHHHHISGGAGF